MLNLVFKFFPRLKLFWFFLLPWAGYAAALSVAPDADPLKPSILLGWVILFIYQFVKLGIIKLETDRLPASQDWKAVLQQLPSLVPGCLIGANQLHHGGEWASYFLEQFAMEVAVLLIAVTAVLLFVKNDKGRTAWQDLAILPLFFTGFVLVGISGILHTWWSQGGYAESDAESMLLLGLALIGELYQQLRMMRRIVRREVIIKDFVEGPWATQVILTQIVLWFALPAIRLL